MDIEGVKLYFNSTWYNYKKAWLRIVQSYTLDFNSTWYNYKHLIGQVF